MIFKPFIDLFNYLSGGASNAGIFASLVSLAATILLVIITSQYVRLTKVIADKSSESLNLTIDKTKEDRTIKFLEGFDPDRYFKLIRLKITDYNLCRNQDIHDLIENIKKKEDFQSGKYKEEIKKFEGELNQSFFDVYRDAEIEVYYYLDKFDLIALFYSRNDLDKIIFSSNIEAYLLEFYKYFKDEIKEISDKKITFTGSYNRFKNYLSFINNHKNS